MQFKTFLEAPMGGPPPGGGMGAPPPMGGMDPMGGGMGGGPPMGGGMDPMGGMGGGLGDPMGGMGGPPMGGGMGGPPQNPSLPKDADVWTVLDSILNHKKLKDDSSSLDSKNKVQSPSHLMN